MFVTLVNRYFVPMHLDNRDGSARRYGMEPGHENAYIIFETPEVPGGPPVDTVILGRLSQVLEVPNATAELRAFLAKHPAFHLPWPELERLAAARDAASRVTRARLLVEQGDATEALALLEGAGPEGALVKARAHRLQGRLDDAEAALAAVPADDPEAALERIRLADARGRRAELGSLLDQYLARFEDRTEAAEAYYLRGWLHHLNGADDQAVAAWQRGITRHPPQTALYSQKAYLTLIRLNWELPEGVDQPR